jgi:dihydroneopterin aldolase / 2-amino-4-hydroxy-6-hydroxymethyldihydropteridine diphosphokinase
MTAGDAGPVLGPDGRPLDRIQLVGLAAVGHHGVFEFERRVGQRFVVDAVLHLDTRPAAADDDLTRTVNYGELAAALADVVRGDPVDLIETLAARLAAVCLDDERVVAVDVAVHKPQAPVPEEFGDVVVAVRRNRDDHLLDRVPDAPVRAVVALGSNLPSGHGDSADTLRSAAAALAAEPGLRLVAASGIWQTAPVGGPEQPDYLNAVLVLDCALSARGLLAVCHRLETGHERRREVRWGPRTLDLDVVVHGDLRSSRPDLQLPHPRAAERAFVLAPWNQADPSAVLPVGGPGEEPRPVADLLAGLAGGATVADGFRLRLDLNLGLHPDGSG